MDHDAEVVSHYQDRYDESSRLDGPRGQLESLRTKQILSRYLQGNRLRIADIGGGPGVYAEWLAGLGHDVVLIDPVPLHIDQAQRRKPQGGSLTALIGDARSVRLDDEWADVVLLLGPLYHLLEQEQRMQALDEASRVLRVRGHLFAAGVSRFASVHDGLVRRFLLDPAFAAIAVSDLESGRHENPARREAWFTSAYFHRPGDLEAEILEAGFMDVAVLGIEGLAGWLPDLDERLAREDERSLLLDFLARIEAEPSIIGVSAHLLAHGIKAPPDIPVPSEHRPPR